MLYQLKLLSDMSDIGEPGPLPKVLQGTLTDEWLADLAWLPPEVTGYTGQGFFPVADPEPAPVVPDAVPRHKAKIALRRAGLLDDADAAIAALDDPDAAIAWADAPEFHRNNPLIAAVAADLDLTDDQVDALFIAAKALP